MINSDSRTVGLMHPPSTDQMAAHVDKLPFVGHAELALHFMAWGCVIAAVVLDGMADHWQPGEIIAEFKPYRFSTTTVDSVVVSFLSACIASGAACKPWCQCQLKL